MKRVTSFISIVVSLSATLFFSGCIKEVTEEYVTVGATVNAYYAKAEVGNWQIYGNEGTEGCYMYQVFDFPEITDEVIKSGAVLAYFCENDGNGRDNMLPYILPYSSSPSTIIENVYFDCEPGYWTVIIESSDFCCAPRTQDMLFKVVIVDP